MRVNSAYISFLNNRLVKGSCIAIMLFAIFFVAPSFKKHSDPDLSVKQLNLIIRQIGHRLLLQAGDSTSRVLPVTENNDGTFLLRFENEFVFNHDSLIVLTQGLLPKTQFHSGYTVTVHDCKKGDIVYGFQVNNTSPDILACRGRSQPIGCYTIEFEFPDFYENIEQKEAGINQLTGSGKVDPQEVDAFPIATGTGVLKRSTLDYDINQGTEKLKSVKGDLREINTIPIAIGTEKLKTTTPDNPLTKFVYIGMLVLLIVTLLIWHFRKISKPVPVQDQNQAIAKESIPELPVLGKFMFDVKGQRLLPVAIGMGSEVISLTDKECKVLELLHKSFGELIPRETLMQEVWINEGVITGRSLDMFVSKLRKKLSSDPELRITNVHGKGYRLEIPERQVV